MENAELEYENNLLAISNAISICKTKTPSHILEMTMGELKKMVGIDFSIILYNQFSMFFLS